MSGRYIKNNVRLILGLIDYNEMINDNSFILFVDYYKAFNTVEHDFLFNILEFFGFGSYFKNAIQTLYKGCRSNGTTHSFDICRGIKQEDPAALFLFLLDTQTITLNINNFHGIKLAEKEIKCCQLADNTTIFLRNENQVKKAIDCLNVFSIVSGL